MNKNKITIGVLALQGDFREHIEVLGKLKVNTLEVRTLEQLKQCHGLIIPGGESTAISRLAKMEKIDTYLKKSKLPIFGTCAGMILLAKKLTGNEVHNFGFIDITVKRNSYGSQLDSFIDTIHLAQTKPNTKKQKIKGVFIRAPQIMSISKNVNVIGVQKDNTKTVPVVVQQNQYLAAAFHPELNHEEYLHKLFIEIVKDYYNI